MTSAVSWYMLEVDVRMYNHVSVLQFVQYPEGTLEGKNDRYGYIDAPFYSVKAKMELEFT